ncbi:MAG: hypothetical protein OXF79_02885 [Chloroflexi bacterium]|nr:hypothetical protein [Chloroflexota bacterium]
MYDYVISYDLKEIEGEERDYNVIKNVLVRLLGARYKMQSFWIAEQRPENNAESVRDLLCSELGSFLRARDVICVVRADSIAWIPPVIET